MNFAESKETHNALKGILERMRKACMAENRRPNDDEKIKAQNIMALIDELEKPTTEPVKSNPDVTGGMGTRLQRASAPFGIVAPDGKKDYRSMFGAHGHQTRWTDEQSNFFSAVFSNRYHPDLITRAMNESVPSDGGFLVPSETAERIHAVSLENEVVMPRAFVQPMTTNEINLPAMDIGDHSSNLFGGFTASYVAEAGTMTNADPKTRLMTLRAKKLTGLLRLSNELAADAIGGEQQIVNICGKGLAWYRDKYFLKGSGSGCPQGILNSPCLLVQAAETGQASGTIVYENLTGVLSKLYPGSFQNSIWICHQSTIVQLLQLSHNVGTGGSHVPVLTESNGEFRILTRPCIFTEKTEALGSQGDIILADLSAYCVGLREGMSFGLSEHVYWTSDELSARLIERHDGQPLWNEALTLEDGTNQVSPFVTLAERT